MELFHSTTEEGARSIVARGFELSHVRDSPGQSWLSSTVAAAGSLASGKGWVVIVDLPAEVAEAHRYRFDDGEPYLDNYCVPWDVLNSYRPFRLERISTD